MSRMEVISILKQNILLLNTLFLGIAKNIYDTVSPLIIAAKSPDFAAD